MTPFDQDGFGVDTAKGLIVYHRWGDGDDGRLERFYIALNFSNTSQDVTLRFAERGTWDNLLSDGEVKVVNNQLNVMLESNWGHVFHSKS
jgi:pullulanase